MVPASQDFVVCRHFHLRDRSSSAEVLLLLNLLLKLHAGWHEVMVIADRKDFRGELCLGLRVRVFDLKHRYKSCFAHVSFAYAPEMYAFAMLTAVNVVTPY